MLIVTFHNDSTGTKDVGNYNVQVLINYTVIWEGRVEGFRRSKGWVELVKKLAVIAKGTETQHESKN